MNTVDPRSRVLAALLFSVLLAISRDPLVSGVALLVAVAAGVGAGIGPRQAFRRLAPINILVLALALLLPWSAGHTPLLTWGSFQYNREGVMLVLAIALKANAIVLWIFVLLHELDMVTMGHALAHLHVPEKLVHLLLLTVRYLELLGGEYHRLRTAMKLRGFRPRVNRHTYRSYGYLIGMLLVRGLDRSERILAAMKCRGFQGRFYLLDHFAFSRRDIWFSAAAMLFAGSLLLIEFS